MIGGLVALDTPQGVQSARDAAHLAGFLPELEAEIGKIVQAIEMQAFRGIRDGTLTPEKALTLWQEKEVAVKLLTRFQKKQQIIFES